MKPLFSVLKSNHNSSSFESPDFVDSKDFYAGIGYDHRGNLVLSLKIPVRPV